MLKITKEMAKEVGVTLTGGPRWIAKYYLVAKDRKVGEGEAEVNAWSVKQARLAICCVEKKRLQCGVKFISCRKEEIELSAEAVDAMNHHKHGCGTATKKNVGVRILLTGTDTAVLSDKQFKKELAGLIKEAAATGANGVEVVNNGSLGELFIELGTRMSEGYKKLGLKVWATVVPDGTYGNFFAEVNVGDAPKPTPEPPKPEPEKESASVDILEALAQKVSAAEERKKVINEEMAIEAAYQADAEKERQVLRDLGAQLAKSNDLTCCEKKAGIRSEIDSIISDGVLDIDEAKEMVQEGYDSVPQESEPVVPSTPIVEEEAIIPEEGDTVSKNRSVERASSVEFHAAVRSIIQQ